MEFLAGTFLWGALAAVIPLALHLTGRSKPIVHPFPALRFILQSHRSASRALRLKHLLLLLLRVLTIVMLALALSRPLWPLAPAAVAGQEGTLTGELVLVLDASMSMGYESGGETRFERARQKALALISKLAPESRVALILATEEPDAAQGRLTLHHEKVRHLLQHAKPTGRGLDLHRALDAAYTLFKRDLPGGLPRMVVLFTDLQANAFKTFAQRSAGEKGSKEKERPALALVDVGEEAQAVRNGAVLEARLPTQTVPADESITLSATIRPVDPNRTCSVALFMDGLKVAEKALQPNGAASLEVPFTFPAGAVGAHAGKLVLMQSDGLPMDQERAIVYVAGRPPRALLVERPGNASRRGSGHFLRAALSSPSAASASGLTLRTVPIERLPFTKISEQKVIILADPGSVGEETWGALKDFVEAGGGLMPWVGPQTDPVSLSRHGYSDFERHRGLLPGRIGAWNALPSNKTEGIRIARPEHPLLLHLNPGLRSALRDVKIQQYLRVTLEPKDMHASVILRNTEGAPVLLEKTYGKGRVFFWTLGPEPSSSDLPQYHGEVFLTLTLDCCRLLAGKEEDITARLGQPLLLAIPDPPADGIVQWSKPDARTAVDLHVDRAPSVPAPEAPPPSLLNTESLGQQRQLAVPALNEPGIHRFMWKAGQGQITRSMYVALNPAAEESDLQRIDRKEASRLLEPWEVKWRDDMSQLLGGQVKEGTGREFPALMLLAVLGLLTIESFLGNRLYRSMSDTVENEG